MNSSRPKTTLQGMADSGPDSPTACPQCHGADTDALSRCLHCGAAVSIGSYAIIEVRSSSQHGRLYVGQDQTGARFAIKEIVFTQVPSLEVLDAFEREASVLRQLTHPRIPKLHSTFQIGEGVQTRCYLVQDLIEGVSLSRKLKSHRVSEDQAIDIAHQVLWILQDLQALTPPVFHRDIKPANLIIAQDEKVSLVDFGAARIEGATANATLVGTYGYMPSEQLAGVIGRSTDLYALGASLIELITRTPPWRALADREKTLGRISSPHLRRWLDRLTQPRPEDRYADAATAWAALTPRRRLLPPGWARHPAALLSASAITAAVVALGIFSMQSPTPVAASTRASDTDDALNRALQNVIADYASSRSDIPGLTESFKRRVKTGGSLHQPRGVIAQGVKTMLAERALTWEDAAQLWPCTEMFFSPISSPRDQLTCVRSVDIEGVDFGPRFLTQKTARLLRDFHEVMEIPEISKHDVSRLRALREIVGQKLNPEASPVERMQRNLSLNQLQDAIVVAYTDIKNRWRHTPLPSEPDRSPLRDLAKAYSEAPGEPLAAARLWKNPGPVADAYQMGNRLILQGQYREAIAQFETALYRDPDFADAHRGMGIAYARLGQSDKAATHYRLYVQKRPRAQDASKVREIIAAYESKP